MGRPRKALHPTAHDTDERQRLIRASDWYSLADKLVNSTKKDGMSSADRPRLKILLAEIFKAMESRLLLAFVNNQGGAVILAGLEDLCVEVNLLKRPKMPEEMLTKWKAYATLARIICRGKFKELLISNFDLVNSKESREYLGPYYVLFIRVLMACDCVDSDGCFKMDVSDVLSPTERLRNLLIIIKDHLIAESLEFKDQIIENTNET